MSFDPRVTPARGDIAAAHLRGSVEAERYVEGVERQVIIAVAPLHEAASLQSRRETELLFGETFRVFDVRDGFAWGQSSGDSYVGYLPKAALGAPPIAPTHRVDALRTITFSEPDIKSAPVLFLSFGAKVVVEDYADRAPSGAQKESGPDLAPPKRSIAPDLIRGKARGPRFGEFARLARGGFAIAKHLAPIDAPASDFVAVAERFLETPYLWGGKGAFGIDCSGLIQIALESAGVSAPRDSDMQEQALGTPLPIAADFSGLRRGDLVFWDGHVGMMLDGERLLHANAHRMKVSIELLREAASRIAPIAGQATSIKRL